MFVPGPVTAGAIRMIFLIQPICAQYRKNSWQEYVNKCDFCWIAVYDIYRPYGPYCYEPNPWFPFPYIATRSTYMYTERNPRVNAANRILWAKDCGSRSKPHDASTCRCVMCALPMQHHAGYESNGKNYNRSILQIPQCTSLLSQNAPFCNKNVQWCILEYVSDALWNLWDGSTGWRHTNINASHLTGLWILCLKAFSG